MAGSNGDWGELLSDLAVLGAESEEESDFAEEDESEDESEFDPITLGAGALAARRLGIGQRRSVRRAKPPANYAQAVKGRNQGVVQTPSGTARIALPGNFPTVDEFQKSVGQIQKDMKANSDGIKELADQQRKDAVRLAEMITTSERKLKKQMKRTQIVAMIGAVAPLAARLIEKQFENKSNETK
jgi:hypothetical protein